ncbi:Cytidine deaminase [Komagataella phaffii CBS 7435]|uniref:Cytidine deaminase n=2 Tax=Komagataella phaffii TaxID=460519 RepID=C4R5D9_KOMPG|nr:Cytidine deaminase [Komagataella phaffii GS115]CAH2449443.1 Cytidine deaminase [Komagataella phaffii CBS 7435]CAY70775.1 Cytidine deaminase [Komagataella phaffii GS115]CCA39431.1 Cytidine deaminase [Komagataella phaffii CBS 7435]
MPQLDLNNLQPPFSQDHRGLTDVEFETLKTKALEARNLSYSPYSNFKVGCSILLPDNTFIKGANVENASYGACICAERTTITHAVMLGHRSFKALAVSTELESIASPCGICRQVIREFADEKLTLPIFMFNKDGSKFVKMTLDDLLPLSFGPEQLQ